MADVTVTATAVKHIKGPVGRFTAAQAITHGQAVWFSVKTNKVRLAQRDGLVEEADGAGVAIGEAVADGQQIDVALPGAVVDFGSGLLAGDYFYPSGTAGALTPQATSAKRRSIRRK